MSNKIFIDNGTNHSSRMMRNEPYISSSSNPREEGELRKNDEKRVAMVRRYVLELRIKLIGFFL